MLLVALGCITLCRLLTGLLVGEFEEVRELLVMLFKQPECPQGFDAACILGGV
jgi:hypothetical protein